MHNQELLGTPIRDVVPMQAQPCPSDPIYHGTFRYGTIVPVHLINILNPQYVHKKFQDNFEERVGDIGVSETLTSWL